MVQGWNSIGMNAMKQASWIVPGVALGLLLSPSSWADENKKKEKSADSSPPPSAQAASFPEGRRDFAVEAYRKLSAEEKGNVFYSPYSVSMALAMTQAGARKETAEQIAKAFHFPTVDGELPKAFKELNDNLLAAAKRDGVQLAVANGLCLVEGDVKPEFRKTVVEGYGAEVFKGDLAKINAWVKEKTEGKIGQILSELHPQSVCVLLNAVYFKGAWETPFSPEQTKEEPFRLSDGKEIPVSFMHRKGSFRLHDEPGFQAIALPYGSGGYEMVVMLPSVPGALPKLEGQLTGADLEAWMAKLEAAESREVDLALPKFKFETDYDFVDPLKKMGVSNAFDAGKADFSGLAERPNGLVISQVRHKAVIEVNEEGAEAAAATAVEMATRGIAVEPDRFRADHPFVFLIREKQTGSLLFIGRVSNPQGK